MLAAAFNLPAIMADKDKCSGDDVPNHDPGLNTEVCTAAVR